MPKDQLPADNRIIEKTSESLFIKVSHQIDTARAKISISIDHEISDEGIKYG